MIHVNQFQKLNLILGDQLNINHSWFKQPQPNVLFVLMEILPEQEYTTQHIQKIAGFFASMRRFAEQLMSKGYDVRYFKIDDSDNLQSFEGNLASLVKDYSIKSWAYQLPDEYRLDEKLESIKTKLNLPCEVSDSEHFMTDRAFLGEFFKGKKTYLMESFYRQIRKDYNILMDGNKPLTGKWNYDSTNRKKLPKNHVPKPPLEFNKDVSEILVSIQKMNIKTIGEVDAKNFGWPTSREESLETLNYFIEELLPLFGDFQDAMTTNSWSVYHSRLSFSLNTKMLHPKEVVDAAINHWQKNKYAIDISQVEGFVRQIIGWREYMRGVYWAQMPNYATLNFFENKNPLPNWFWSGETKMNCLKQSIKQSLKYSYAHHIQRLMVTGNFALLAGLNPDEIDQWYLGIYIDAIEWVEITNTRGMSQFADGGIVGTKPYVSSAAYINKMGNYCEGCFYKKDLKVGERACPFNSLYWNFYDQHREKLQKNQRIGMMYRVWDKMKPEAKAEILTQAKYNLENINSL